jgi:colanic acid biosynthesis glycosyl transferase WcaI
LTNVVLRPPVARQDLAASLADCDVAIVSMIGGMAGVSVPSRLYNVLAAGRPFIAVADADSEPAMIAQEASAGWVVAPGDAASLTAAIRAAKNDRAALAEMGQRARRLAETRYTREGVVDLYRRLVERLLNE